MKVKTIIRFIFKPRRAYKGLLILFSSVFLYVIVYHSEFSIDVPVSTQQFPLVKESRMKSKTTTTEKNVNSIESEHIESENEKSNEERIGALKYILLWTPTITPFNHIRKRGRVPFISNDCQYTNCFLTHRKFYFPDQTRFDAIVFSIAALKNLQTLPLDRSPRQKFIAASIEPPQKHPVLNPIYDNYFNWTWTYRLNSDILWRKFQIFNMKKEIGPKKDIKIKWMKRSKQDSKDNELQIFLSSKKKSVVWIRNNCEVNKYNSRQLQYIMDLENELNNNGLSLITYSNCSGYDRCGTMIECTEQIQQDFYFYLAFEDYIDQDYVTDILLFALECYAIPVVFGGADYSSFLPPGSFLDARKLKPREVANIIDNTMSDYTIFMEYFTWVFYYRFQTTGLESEVCNICTALNNETMVKSFSIHDKFRKEWSGEDSVLVSDFLFKALKYDGSLKEILANGSYTDIRKAIINRHLTEPKDSVFIFDIQKLSVTSTDETELIPDELTTDN